MSDVKVSEMMTLVNIKHETWRQVRLLQTGDRSVAFKETVHLRFF